MKGPGKLSYSPRILDAFALMYELHGGQTRKGADVPYITHLLAVGALVGEHGGTEDQFIAALLHDSVEDQGGLEVLKRIRSAFGDSVADWVWACSDTTEDPKPPWRQRKEHHIAAAATAPAEAKLILAADKLHNLRSMRQDYAVHGEGLWERFKGGREGTPWYYREMAAALGRDWDHPILVPLNEEIAALEAIMEK